MMLSCRGRSSRALFSGDSGDFSDDTGLSSATAIAMSAAPVNRAKTSLKRLQSLHEAGRLDEAEAGYRDWVARRPDDAGAWQLYGVIAFQRGQHQRAIERLTRALELRPDFPQALSNLGSVMLAMGQIDQAEKLYRLALKYDPDYPEAVGNLGALLNTREQFEAALPFLRRAVALRPDHAMAHNNLGNALEQLDRTEQARAAYGRALELAPDHPVSSAASVRCTGWRGSMMRRSSVLIARWQTIHTASLPCVDWPHRDASHPGTVRYACSEKHSRASTA